MASALARWDPDTLAPCYVGAGVGGWAPGGGYDDAWFGAWPGDTSISGTAASLYRPGPYVLEQLTSIRVCADPQCFIDAYSSHTETAATSFDVLGTSGKCPHKGDTSHFPAFSYINQYDAGTHLSLPRRFGDAGGNACGPSALLMGMLRSLNGASTNVLPSLTTTFDATMQIASGKAAHEQSNNFDASKALRWLKTKRVGWTQAQLWKLGFDEPSSRNAQSGSLPDPSNEARIAAALDRGPVVVSTNFSTRKWGLTGGGHMILIERVDPLHPGEYVVDDPSGNYFASPVGGHYPSGHYGAGSCGYQVDYPKAWMLAFTTGKYLISLGQR